MFDRIQWGTLTRSNGRTCRGAMLTRAGGSQVFKSKDATVWVEVQAGWVFTADQGWD